MPASLDAMCTRGTPSVLPLELPSEQVHELLPSEFLHGLPSEQDHESASEPVHESASGRFVAWRGMKVALSWS